MTDHVRTAATPEQGEGPAKCEACGACGERVGIGTGSPAGHMCDDGTYACQPPPDWSPTWNDPATEPGS